VVAKLIYGAWNGHGQFSANWASQAAHVIGSCKNLSISFFFIHLQILVSLYWTRVKGPLRTLLTYLLTWGISSTFLRRCGCARFWTELWRRGNNCKLRGMKDLNDAGEFVLSLELNNSVTNWLNDWLNDWLMAESKWLTEWRMDLVTYWLGLFFVVGEHRRQAFDNTSRQVRCDSLECSQMPEVFLPHYSGFAFFICFMMCRIDSKEETETKQVDKALFLHSVFFLSFSFTRNNVTLLFIGNVDRELFVTLSISIKVLFLSRGTLLENGN